MKRESDPIRGCGEDSSAEHDPVRPIPEVDGRVEAMIRVRTCTATCDHTLICETMYSRTAREVEQTLGKALGYPWFKDDQKNFPGATEEDGVCVGEHVPESIAEEAARRIAHLAVALTRRIETCGCRTSRDDRGPEYGKCGRCVEDRKLLLGGA